MILTDKALNDFHVWLLTAGNEQIKDGQTEYDLYYVFQYMLPERVKSNLIIEWLDSVGIHIRIEPHIGGGADVYYPTLVWRDENFIERYEAIDNSDYFKSRFEATEAAAKKANEIYNS